MSQKAKLENLPLKKMHSWRVCPEGQHWRSGHTQSTYQKKDGTIVKEHWIKAGCCNNRSNKDQLYKEEVEKIANEYFRTFKPLPILKKFKDKNLLFDNLIQGWTTYWNEVLKPKVPLDPLLVKALIASESSFNPSAWNGKKGLGRARGLMQVTDQTLTYLSNPKTKELKDHFVHFTQDDMLDANASICAGIRWLFRKKDLAKTKANRNPSWRDAIYTFKSAKQNPEVMKKFDEFYKELTRKGNLEKSN